MMYRNELKIRNIKKFKENRKLEKKLLLRFTRAERWKVRNFEESLKNFDKVTKDMEENHIHGF